MFFKPSVLLADVSISLLVALLTAGLGVVFSLRSSTVQQAQQATMSVLLLPAMLLQFGMLFILRSESAKQTLNDTLGALSFGQLIALVVSILALAAAAVLWLALARFRRARLILSQ